MKLSKKTVSKQEKIVSRIELACCQDAKPDLIFCATDQPENVAPDCPMKLHGFMVMASYVTRWHKVMNAPDKFIAKQDYN